MSTTPELVASTTKTDSCSLREEALSQSVGDEEAEPQSVTDKLLLELELLGSMQHTASKLDEFEMDSLEEPEAATVPMEEDNEISDLKKAKDELMSTLNRVRSDIDVMERQKQKNERLADEHIDLIKRTGLEMTRLISQTQEHLNSENEQKHLELLKMSTNILSDQHHQADKEKQELQNTLNIAMKLLDQYAHNLKGGQTPPSNARPAVRAQEQQKSVKDETENAEIVSSDSHHRIYSLPSLKVDDRLLQKLDGEKVSMVDRMLSDLGQRQQHDDREESAGYLSSKTPVSSAVFAKTGRSETTAYSEFTNQLDSEYSDDAFDALTDTKSPKQQISGSNIVDSASDTATEIEFDEDGDDEDEDEEDDDGTRSQSDVGNEVISVSESMEMTKGQAFAGNEEMVSVATSATEISFDVESTIIEDGEEQMASDVVGDVATESVSEIQTEIESEVDTDIDTECASSVHDEEEDADREYEDDYDEMGTEVMSIENAEALSTTTSTLSSLIPIETVPKEVVGGDAERDEVSVETVNTVETAHSYGSSLDRMDTLSSNDKAGSSSFSDTVSSILSESLSFIESSVRESGENEVDNASAKEEALCDHEDPQEIEESDDSNHDESVGDSNRGESERLDVQQQAAALSLDLMSDFVTDLWAETSALYELRRNRASILSRQNQIERTLDESVGIFCVEPDGDVDGGVESGDESIRKYVEEILAHCNPRDWSMGHPTTIAFSVFIEVETRANRKEEQQIFNNLVFDTLNEALAQIKPNSKRTRSSTKRLLVESVQRMMRNLIICDTADRLKDRFGDDQEIDDRIRTVSTDWIQKYEHSTEWTSSLSVFQSEIQMRTADLIFDQMITDIVSELSQIERTRDARL